MPDNGAAAQERAGTREFYVAPSILPLVGWLGLTWAAHAAGTDLELCRPSVHPSIPLLLHAMTEPRLFPARSLELGAGCPPLPGPPATFPQEHTAGFLSSAPISRRRIW